MRQPGCQIRHVVDFGRSETRLDRLARRRLDRRDLTLAYGQGQGHRARSHRVEGAATARRIDLSACQPQTSGGVFLPRQGHRISTAARQSQLDVH